MYKFIKKNKVLFFIVFIIIIITYITLFLVKNQAKNTISNPQKSNFQNSDETKIENDLEQSLNDDNTDNVKNMEETIEDDYELNNWRIIIPKIHLDAPIQEGTTKEVLRKAVGHFINTSRLDGNVALAAHNRGYKYNFFQNIKQLEIGDTIIYKNENEVRNYKVIKKNKIKETDLSCLENTNENTITLITCVENMPEYRYCIKALQNK